MPYLFRNYYPMPFFDFHIHPTLKTLFSADSADSKQFSPWERLKESDINWLVRGCSELGRIVQSQSSLSQLVVNDCNLIVMALHFPETAVTAAKMITSAAKGSMSKYLQLQRLEELLTISPYQTLIAHEYQTLTDTAHWNVTDRKVKILFSKDDYNPDDSKTIHVVFSVEGCHSFLNNPDQFDAEIIKNNISDMLSRLPLISVNLTHMQQSPVCNHAYGMQFLADSRFMPSGHGLSYIGKDIVKHCFQNKVCIDIKHMSLMARFNLYDYLKTDEIKSIAQPVICTHAGFSGISKSELPDYILEFKPSDNGQLAKLKMGKPVKYGYKFERPCFNTSAINLCDEDIMQILNSGGIIGLSLDKRILGYQQDERNLNSPEAQDDEYAYETDYVPNTEFDFHVSGKRVFGKAFELKDCMRWDDIDTQVLMADYHLRYFMAHILHIISIAGKHKYDVTKALKQICIGSDMDGLINPISTCDTYDDIYHFKQKLIDSFQNFAAESKVALPSGFNMKSFAEDLFFRNGRDFVFSRLRKLN